MRVAIRTSRQWIRFATNRFYSRSTKNVPVLSRINLQQSPPIHVGSILIPKRNFNPSEVRYSSPKIVPFLLSDIGEGIKEVTVKEWFVSPGDTVNQFDQICEVQSDKASVTITSRYDGVIKKLYYEVDEMAETGYPLVDIEITSGEDAESSDQTEIQDTEAVNILENESQDRTPRPEGKRLATPAVRRVAMEQGVNLEDIVGSGKSGRILKDDIYAYVESKKSKTSITPVAPKLKIPTPASPPPVASDSAIPMSPYVKAMVKSMNESLTIPHFGYSDEILFNKLYSLKKSLKKSSGIKISYMPFILKAASISLKDYPILNSTPNFSNETIVQKNYHNIGVAMDTPNGLLVPNIKNVQNLSVLEISEELVRLMSLGHAGKLGSSDLSGGTFSLSNIGSIGGTYAKPVIVPGQVIIGALGKVQKLPRFDWNDDVYAAHVLNVSWSADHRILDGATVARFSNKMKDLLENPEYMALYLK